MDIRHSDIQERLDRFKHDLKYPTGDIVHKHILTGAPIALSDEGYFLLRNRVAAKFRIQPVEVVLVGSCRMGFMLMDKSEQDRPRYSHVHPGSDLDIAIVSARLFNEYWDLVHGYSNVNWAFLTTDQGVRFQQTLFCGWIDPDGLPPSNQFAKAREWWQFFREITQDRRYGNRRANARIYRSWEKIALYQQRAVEQCKRDAKGPRR